MTALEYVATPILAVRDGTLTAADHRMLGAVAVYDRRGVNGRGCFAAVATLAAMAVCDISTAERSIAKLRRQGLIRVERSDSNGRQRVYRVVYQPMQITREPAGLSFNDDPHAHGSSHDETDENTREAAGLVDANDPQAHGESPVNSRLMTRRVSKNPQQDQRAIRPKENKKQNKKQISRSDEADPAQAASIQKIDANSKAVFDRLLADPVIDGWLARVECFLPDATEAQLLELTWKLEEWAEGHGEGEPIHGRARRLAVQAHDLIQQMERTAP